MAQSKSSKRAVDTGNSASLVGGEFVRRKPLNDLFLSAKAAKAAEAQSNALHYEDEFAGKYGGGVPVSSTGTPIIIAPPFLPRQLEGLVLTNNSLMSCIDAMVTNVYGTGGVIEYRDPRKDPKRELGRSDEEPDLEKVVPPKKEAAKADQQMGKEREDPEDPEDPEEPMSPDDFVDPKIKKVEDFLSEVWPGVSFDKLKRQIGDAIEKTGYACVEVIRNMRGEMLFLRMMDSKLTRLVLLSNVFNVELEIKRGDASVKATVPMRYRRFVQQIGIAYVYFKEYGCPLLINKMTGELFDPAELPGKKLELIKEKKLGSEVIYFGKVPDAETPYHVPAWIPQMPSVLGSRKAEEYNLEFFDAGGIPPMMVFVHGGVMAPAAKQALEEFLSATPGSKSGAPVFEVVGTGGTDGGGNSVRVTVERFGADRQKDAMFDIYDKRCEERIRRAWRLPPIFVGQAQDYSFATAHASYAVGEAQVFKPERDEFDDVINTTIMRELDPTGELVYRSKAVQVKDVDNQLEGIKLATDKEYIDPGHAIEAINDATGLHLKPSTGIDAIHRVSQAERYAKSRVGVDQAINPPAEPTSPIVLNPGQALHTPDGKPLTKPLPAPKTKGDLEPALTLAEDVFECLKSGGNGSDVFELLTHVVKLSDDEVTAFREAFTAKVYEAEIMDDELTKLTGAALLMAAMAR